MVTLPCHPNIRRPFDSSNDRFVLEASKTVTLLTVMQFDAHHVLQIRAMMASDAWESKCQAAVLSAPSAVA
jgi:hypothetical protein